jgi:hypothetical protein
MGKLPHIKKTSTPVKYELDASGKGREETRKTSHPPPLQAKYSQSHTKYLKKKTHKINNRVLKINGRRQKRKLT